MPEIKKISAPLDDKAVALLRAGDEVLLSGTIYTARDAAHLKGIPFKVKGQVIFYAGPTPGKNSLVGSIGPTTSSRMDRFMPDLLKKGLKGTIGKGTRSEKVRQLLKKHKAVYFTATGGVAALMGKKIKKAEPLAYEELGAEAVLKLEVSELPLIVAYDAQGGDIFEQGRKKYEVK